MRHETQVKLQNEFISVEFSKLDLLVIFSMLDQHVEDEGGYGFSLEEKVALEKNQNALKNLSFFAEEDRRTEEEVQEDVAQIRKQVLKLGMIAETIALKEKK